MNLINIRLTFMVFFIPFCILTFINDPLYLDHAFAQDNCTILASDGLRVRSGPSTSYSVLGGLVYGTKILPLEVKNGWYKITFKGKDGWIIDDWVSQPCEVGDSNQNILNTTNSSQTRSENIQIFYVTANSGLRVRSGPGTNFPKIGLLDKGTQIEVISVDSSGKWYGISYNSGIGWVSAQYTTSTNPNVLFDTDLWAKICLGSVVVILVLGVVGSLLEASGGSYSGSYTPSYSSLSEIRSWDIPPSYEQQQSDSFDMIAQSLSGKAANVSDRDGFPNGNRNVENTGLIVSALGGTPSKSWDLPSKEQTYQNVSEIATVITGSSAPSHRGFGDYNYLTSEQRYSENLQNIAEKLAPGQSVGSHDSRGEYISPERRDAENLKIIEKLSKK